MRTTKGLIIKNIQSIAQNLSNYLDEYIDFVENKYEEGSVFTENNSTDCILSDIQLQLKIMSDVLDSDDRRMRSEELLKSLIDGRSKI